MKLTITLTLVLWTGFLWSQTAEIVEQSAHHRVWQTVVKQVDASGLTVQRTNRYTELGTGMAYFDPESGQWKETRELIELIDGLAVARYAGHKAIFAPNANVDTALDFSTPDGRFRSHVLGLSFQDVDRQEIINLAIVQDSIGEVIPPNQVIYRNAFRGVLADIVYTFKKAGIEQDVVLREALPIAPEDVGFSRESTVLEVTTAFLESPVPSRTVRMKGNFRDERLHFGTMMMGSGHAFMSADRRAWSIPVQKSWVTIDDAAFLVEAVPYSLVIEKLEGLPRHQAAVAKPTREMVAKIDRGRRPMPVRSASLRPKAQVQVASLGVPRDGLVSDYVTVYGTNTWVFKGDETYRISSWVVLTNATPRVRYRDQLRFRGGHRTVRRGIDHM